MFGRKIRLLAILAAILLITGTFLVYSEGQRSKPSAELKAEIEGPLVVDFPLIFKLTATNTGEVPFYYWCRASACINAMRLFLPPAKWARVMN